MNPLLREPHVAKYVFFCFKFMMQYYKSDMDFDLISVYMLLGSIHSILLFCIYIVAGHGSASQGCIHYYFDGS
jgi:hypothetical protein